MLVLLHATGHNQAPGPSSSRREDTGLISQREACQGHSVACRLGNAATILEDIIFLTESSPTSKAGQTNRGRRTPYDRHPVYI